MKHVSIKGITLAYDRASLWIGAVSAVWVIAYFMGLYTPDAFFLLDLLFGLWGVALCFWIGDNRGTVSAYVAGLCLFVITTTIVITPLFAADRPGLNESNRTAILESAEQATETLEHYRDDIEALIRGVPAFEDRRTQLQSLIPGLYPDAQAPAAVSGTAPAQNTSTLMVFVSLSMPDDALAGWLEQAARAGGVAVIRGFHEGRFSSTLERMSALQEQAPATAIRGGVSIDPTAFTRFDVRSVPVVIVSDDALIPCASRGCTDDPAPAHDRIAGNITLEAALRRLVAEGDAAQDTAQQHLTRLTEAKSVLP